MQETQRLGFHLWVGKSPWRRKRQPSAVFLPRKPHDRGAWQTIQSMGPQRSDMTQQLSTHTCMHTQGLKQNPLPALTNVYWTHTLFPVGYSHNCDLKFALQLYGGIGHRQTTVKVSFKDSVQTSPHINKIKWLNECHSKKCCGGNTGKCGCHKFTTLIMIISSGTMTQVRVSFKSWWITYSVKSSFREMLALVFRGSGTLKPPETLNCRTLSRITIRKANPWIYDKL